MNALDQATDVLNGTLRRVEEYLRGLNFSVTAMVPFSQGNGGYFLRFGKDAGAPQETRWKLFLVHIHDDMEEVTPLLSVSREWRTAVTTLMLDALVAQLRQQMRIAQVEVETRRADLERWLDAKTKDAGPDHDDTNCSDAEWRRKHHIPPGGGQP